VFEREKKISREEWEKQKQNPPADEWSWYPRSRMQKRKHPLTRTEYQKRPPLTCRRKKQESHQKPGATSPGKETEEKNRSS